MNKYKKIIKVTPMVFVLSTAILASPGHSLAAVQSTVQSQQDNSIKGYKLQNGKLSPVYESSFSQKPAAVNPLQVPEAPDNPKEDFPLKGESKDEIGKPLTDYVYINVVSHVEKSELTMSSDLYQGKYKILKPDGSSEMQFPFKAGTVRPGDVLYIVAIPKDDPILSDTTLERKTSYQRVSQDIIEQSGTYHYGQNVSTGITNETAWNFALTLGASYTATAGGGPLPASASYTLSASLETSFGTKHTVSSEKTITKNVTFGPALASYKYPNYKVAVYQVKSTYTVKPGKKLSDWLKYQNTPLSKRTDNDPNIPKEMLEIWEKPLEGIEHKIQSEFTYNEDDLYFTRTKGAGTYISN
ncbi:hypothetical protein [Bacillus cereus]|uniref:Uncharacterized protein n=1 Tax=Bacillus cereus TaxID=1396 RepID=A0A9X7M1P0_BACCE|nr:hypothetical protein [Bacillus cereus]QDZ77160.1 hypothetical protein D0437_31045 [Bacillus cereus]